MFSKGKYIGFEKSAFMTRLKFCLHCLQVHGKRFVYKFVCDLRMLLGYTAGELNKLVRESSELHLQKVRDSLKPAILRKIEVQ